MQRPTTMLARLIIAAVGTTFYSSENIQGPKDKYGTILKAGPHGCSILGQLSGRVKLLDERILNLYRYEYNAPLVVKTTRA